MAKSESEIALCVCFYAALGLRLNEHISDKPIFTAHVIFLAKFTNGTLNPDAGQSLSFDVFEKNVGKSSDLKRVTLVSGFVLHLMFLSDV